MTYSDLQQVGYRFVNYGERPGDQARPPGLCWYGILAPDGTQIDTARGSPAALAVARKHYNSHPVA